MSPVGFFGMGSISTDLVGLHLLVYVLCTSTLLACVRLASNIMLCYCSNHHKVRRTPALYWVQATTGVSLLDHTVIDVHIEWCAW